jgi:hypothetical protein
MIITEHAWVIIAAIILGVLVLVLVVVSFARADDRCGFPPGTRIGCRGTPICACDENGCKWVWLECER